MNASRIAAAVVWAALFGALAFAIWRSALGDWREGRQDRDGGTAFSALQQGWLAVVAAAMAVAVAVPVVLIATA